MISLRVCALALVTSLTVAGEASSGITLLLEPIGTPGIMGPPKIDDPAFIPPMLVSVRMPDQVACLMEKGAGTYEALITKDGTVASIKSRHEPIAGTDCERRSLFPNILEWRFRPATFQGKPIPVYLDIRLRK
jgi:hypothetical protein